MLPFLRPLRSRLLPSSQPRIRSLTLTPPLRKDKYSNLPPREPLDPDSYTVTFLKGSGPGGQKINKTSSAVQLKHLPTGHVIKCQETRSQSQNLKLAMRKLQDHLDLEENGEGSRTAMKRALMARTKANKAKKSRRKYARADEVREESRGGESRRERLMKMALQTTGPEGGLRDAKEMEEKCEEADEGEGEILDDASEEVEEAARGKVKDKAGPPYTIPEHAKDEPEKG